MKEQLLDYQDYILEAYLINPILINNILLLLAMFLYRALTNTENDSGLNLYSLSTMAWTI